MLVLSCGDAPLQPVPVEEPFASISAGGYTTCALTSGGSAFCWGRGTSGQLGNGGEENQGAPVPVKGGHRFSSVSTGYYHACGLAFDGEAWCWGATADGDDSGQLGQVHSGGSTEPVRIETGLRFRQLAAGQAHTCGLTDNGEAYCWGGNLFGQLGDGTTRDRTGPVAVIGGQRFAWISAGATHTCGATIGGEALCWGDNFFGAVTGSALAHTPDTCAGGGDQRCTLLPHTVALDASVAAISGGTTSTCAIGRNGAWYCWGGSLREPVPPRLMQDAAVTAVSTGASHWCAIDAQGAASCWGGNDLGQLGADGPAGFTATPVAVSGGVSFRSISTGMFHTCGVSMEGSAYCWGSNHYEALGGAGATSTCGSESCRRSPGRIRS
jgi:alpha-tubulin suppressor-like RCC1 family protein